METYNPGPLFKYTSAWDPSRAHPVTGAIRPHRGEDWGAPSGTLIPAAGDGKVVYKGEMNGYGNVVVLEHANNKEIVHTLYAHMEAESPLSLGNSIAKGNSVGKCGNTGIGTGSHLHFEVLRNGTAGKPNLAKGHATVDPRKFDISNLTNPDAVQQTAQQPTASRNDSFQFPVRKPDNTHYTAEDLYKELDKELSGHYLLGNHNFWHGGIHFSEKSIPHCKIDQPIRCIADGEVIAYRLNKHYLQSNFKGLTQCTNLQYSTSFCLVRHTYESPQRAPEKQEQPKVNWVGRRISLSCARYGRDVADVKLGKSGNFEALMPVATELQILEIQDSVHSGYRFANAKIISGELAGTDKDGQPSTHTTGETVWFAALNKNGDIIKDKNSNEIFKILNPDPPKKNTPAPTSPDRNTLTFYSLYMHLLPFEIFQENESLFKRMVKIKADGLNVRASANLNSESLGLISKGANLEILATDLAYKKKPEDTTTYELAQAKIISGTVIKSGRKTAATGDTIWLALSMTEEGKPTQKFSDEIPKQTLIRPRYWRGKISARAKTRIAAFQNPDDEDTKRIGLVAENSTLEYHTDSLKKVSRAGQEKTMAKCSIASGGLWDRQLCPAFVWICIDDTALELRADPPNEFDKVVSVSIPIKAGDPISYLGLYETPASINGDKNSHHQMHFEIFTDDKNLNKFLRNEAEIRDGRQYLFLPKDTEVHNKSILTTNQFLPTPTPSRLKREHAIELSKCPIQKDEKGQEWYLVTVYDNAQTIAGLVKKPNSSTLNNVEIITQHDWEKLGFRIIEENNPDADGFLDPDDMPSFFQDLYREIDQLGDQDGRVTPAELQVALRDPALRERWSKLIGYHPTEWQAKSNEPKWSVLEDLLIENYETIKKQSGNSNTQLINNLLNCTRELFRHEKERIDNLVFWSELEGAMQINLPEQVYHFHPISFLENIAFKKTSMDDLIQKIGDIIAHGEGGYESYNTGTKGVPNDAVGYSFINPGPGTVTGKTIDEIISTEGLLGTDKNRLFATGKYQTIIPTLRDAQIKLGVNGSELYNQNLQERIFREYLIYKAGEGKLAKFVKHAEGSVEDAQHAAAREWASIAVPAGRAIADGRISDGTLSHHDSRANKANMNSTNSLIKVLNDIAKNR